MGVTTSQQITFYFDQYADVEVTFTKDVIRATLLNQNPVFPTSLGYHWPCILYGTSMKHARIIANATPQLNETLKRANNLVSLRLSFLQRDKSDPLSFFVPARVSNVARYADEKEHLSVMSLQYSQRPNDDLIAILGALLDANVASKKRKEERVTLTVDSIRRLGLVDKTTSIYIDGVPRKAILRDLSFSGAKLLIMGVAKFIVNKSCVVRLEFMDQNRPVDLPGKVLRNEPVEGREDISAFVVLFDEEQLPASYKLRLNDYLKQMGRAGLVKRDE